MQQTTFKFEYDFKTIPVEIINPNTGKLKQKYICLPYMITTKLTEPLNPLGPPNQPIPQFNTTTLTSNSSTNGWLNYMIVNNEQSNIITVRDQGLFINYFPYNYDVIATVNTIGVDTVDLRFMAINPFTAPPRATNMNDIFGAETSYSNIRNGQTIQFTVTGQYQYFFINYPTSNFNITITIRKSNVISPIFICNRTKSNCNKGSCRCFEIDGRGYIKIKKKDGHIDVPVYVIQDTQTLRTKYLYPEFGYLRDLFFNVTIANSLMPPSINEGINKIKQNITTLETGIVTITAWAFYKGPLDNELLKLVPDLLGGFFNQIQQKMINPANGFSYRYSWDQSGILILNAEPLLPPVFAAYVWKDSSWTQLQTYPLRKIGPNTIDGQGYGLDSGMFDNLFGYEWVAFGLANTSGINEYISEARFNINVENIFNT